MTPYAVLLVTTTDSDDVIRKAYYALAKQQHPDAEAKLEASRPSNRWQATNEAYRAIRSYQDRVRWDRAMKLRSDLCKRCGGEGVVGSRIGKGVRVCAACKGEGAIRSA